MQIRTTEKPLEADEAARKEAAEQEVKYRAIAITNYRRALQVGYQD